MKVVDLKNDWRIRLDKILSNPDEIYSIRELLTILNDPSINDDMIRHRIQKKYKFITLNGKDFYYGSPEAIQKAQAVLNEH